MRYWLETRGSCMYCGGAAKHYECIGDGCDDCHGSGICPHCEDGKETWLFFTNGNGKRGSCLNRAEITAYRADGTPPDWWAAYHGLAEQST